MPELPEVEVVKMGLGELLPGRKITGVKSSWPKSFQAAKSDADIFLIGAKVIDIRRRAKVLIIDLDTKFSLVIHLKMTGQLVFRSSGQKFGAGHPTSSLVDDLPDRSTRVIIDFEDAKLFFNDQRKFGWIKLLPTIEVPNIDFFVRVGPEPLAADFTNKDFIDRFKRRPNSAIKAALLDQSVIAGVGNIYADESLWGAKIHPTTRVKDIPHTKLKILFKELQYVLRLSIEKGGSTDRNYVDAKGKKGSYLKFARVFRRECLPCPRCGTIIIKSKVAGRGTHTCPKCQKI